MKAMTKEGHCRHFDLRSCRGNSIFQSCGSETTLGGISHPSMWQKEPGYSQLKITELRRKWSGIFLCRRIRWSIRTEARIARKERWRWRRWEGLRTNPFGFPFQKRHYRLASFLPRAGWSRLTVPIKKQRPDHSALIGVPLIPFFPPWYPHFTFGPRKKDARKPENSLKIQWRKAR